MSPIYRIISEKLVLKTPKLYKECMGSLTSLPSSNFAVFTVLSFVVACKELKIAQAAQITKSFNSIGSLSNDDGDGNANGKKATG